MSPMTSRPLTKELALLGYLRSGPLHGYQIHQCLLQPDGPGMVWRLKQAQLYALLGKLEEAGFIQSSLQAQETRPTRRVYQLTAQGQAAYNKWLLSPVNTPRQIRQEFLIKLYFAQQEKDETVSVLVDNQLSVCQSWLDLFRDQLATTPVDSFMHIVCQYRLGQIQATFAWLQQLKN